MGLQAQACIDAPKCIVVSLKYFCWAINQGVWVAGRRSRLLDSSKADFKHRIYHQSGYSTKLPLCLCPVYLRSLSVKTLSLPSIIGKRIALLSFVPISDCTQVYARTRALKPALYACPMQACGIGTAHRHYARARSSTQRLHVYSRVAPMGVHVRERTALASSSLRARFKGQIKRA